MVNRKRLASEVELTRDRKVLIDGLEFPFYLASEGPYVENYSPGEGGSGLSVVWLPVIVETSGVDRRMPTEDERPDETDDHTVWWSIRLKNF